MPQTLTSDQNFDRMVWCHDHNLPGPSRDGSELHLEKKIKVVAPLAASMIPCFAKFHANIAVLRTQTVVVRMTPLQVAAEQGKVECLRALLENGAEIEAKDKFG